MNQSNRTGRQRWGEGLQPIPETREAIDELDPAADADDLLRQLQEKGRRVRELVPDCIGLSLATVVHGVTLTLVASDHDIALLDSLQYLDDGPCVDAVENTRIVTFDAGAAESSWESRWQLFAEASAAVGVRSTLSLPILVEDDVAGSVNLYAASVRAFQGLHEQIAAVFQAWAPGAVSNADLPFRTRDQARQAPRILRESARIDAAVGSLVSMFDLDVQEARDRLRDAALRGGVEDAQLAEALLRLLEGPRGPRRP